MDVEEFFTYGGGHHLAQVYFHLLLLYRPVAANGLRHTFMVELASQPDGDRSVPVLYPRHHVGVEAHRLRFDL